jgi:hypothetical protein
MIVQRISRADRPELMSDEALAAAGHAILAITVERVTAVD